MEPIELTYQMSSLAIVNAIHQQNLICFCAVVLSIISYRHLRDTNFSFKKMSKEQGLRLMGLIFFVSALLISLGGRYFMSNISVDKYFLMAPTKIQVLAQLVYIVQGAYLVAGSGLSLISGFFKEKK